MKIPLAIMYLLAATVTAGAQYALEWGRVASGTIMGEPVGTFRLSGTAGQADAHESPAAAMRIDSGFWAAGFNDPPTISIIGDQTGQESIPIGPLAFEVSDTETGAARVSVDGVSVDPVLVAPTGISLGGSGSNRTLTLHPVIGQTGVTLVTVTATDGELESSIQFQATVLPNPINTWRHTHFGSAIPVGDAVDDADPDKDGRNNLTEFALDGNPLSGANNDKVIGQVAAVSGDEILTLTLPVRDLANFPVGTGDRVSDPIDGIVYHIEGGMDLNTFADTISEVTPALDAGLPALSTGWSYRTFRAPGTVSTIPRAFLRAKISEAP